MLSEVAPSTIFWVFGTTRTGIEPWSPWLLANTLLIRPIFVNVHSFIMVSSFIILPVGYATIIFRVVWLEVKTMFLLAVWRLKIVGLGFLSKEFIEKDSARVSAIAFFCGFCVVFQEVFERGWLGSSRDFSDHFSNGICFGKGIRLVYRVLPAFFLGFLYGFVCFWPG